ncbi:TetR/AcrR family transcriptional regulator [Corallococcus macrosporus]|uniref:TetR family transcriptional regulator n=1 Tax=Corallococcus macrosporus DSM 14697 TaxID=1189310 RepID=A0A250JTS2_9BACT|nr:TetR/AcrR family transcriptional regulator [Corallococcus macrosporus]ATB47068.1 TetR family transcriptional regulator [Corallococcus macrosporus DSM 14697]
MGQQSKPAADNGTRESERRRTILRAAIDVFARKGYHGCRIADVAKEAGVAYGLVYHYFKNKDELLETVFDTGWSGFVTRVRTVVEGEGSLAEKVHGIVEVAFEAYRVDPRAVKVLILEIARSPAGSRINRQTAFVDAIRLSSALFHAAQERGELRTGLDPHLASALLFGNIEMALTAFVVGLADARDPDALERARSQIADSFLYGVLTGAQAAEVSEWKPEKSATKSKAPKRS